ncbi:MAG: DUF1553 domain-containing protein, partial [Verrucomicrobiota bacterium]
AAGSVLSHIKLQAIAGNKVRDIKLTHALSPGSEKGFPPKDALQGKNRNKNGWAPGATSPHHLTLLPERAIELKPEEQLRLVIEQKHQGGRPLLKAYSLELSSDETLDHFKAMSDEVYALLDADQDDPMVLQHYRGIYPGFQDIRAQRQKLDSERKEIEKRDALTMIASDGGMRKNYFLNRGEYDQRGDEVPIAAPASIMPFDDNLPRNRLGLSQWMVDPNNPLPARVVVNRYWQMIFGTGLVKTPEDFGTQGAQPSHPELLDTLTVQFMASGWDVKALLKKILLSNTYRQSGIRPDGMDIRDPDNALLSYITRQRLQAEFLRDHALMAGNGLVFTMGGPGVHPYQPAELFGRNAIGSSNARFSQSTGDGLYRRSLYTYWKRQIPAANMRILGADGRTVCRTRRERTNTPLQALVTLNDPQFVEAARMLGERVMREAQSPEDRTALAFRIATSRRPEPAERVILMAELRDRLAEFKAQPATAMEYLKVGARPRPEDIPPEELAAYSAVASLILNLDESLSRR